MIISRSGCGDAAPWACAATKKPHPRVANNLPQPDRSQSHSILSATSQGVNFVV